MANERFAFPILAKQLASGRLLSLTRPGNLPRPAGTRWYKLVRVPW